MNQGIVRLKGNPFQNASNFQRKLNCGILSWRDFCSELNFHSIHFPAVSLLKKQKTWWSAAEGGCVVFPGGAELHGVYTAQGTDVALRKWESTVRKTDYPSGLLHLWEHPSHGDVSTKELNDVLLQLHEFSSLLHTIICKMICLNMRGQI
jgi:hypothetical protein